MSYLGNREEQGTVADQQPVQATGPATTSFDPSTPHRHHNHPPHPSQRRPNRPGFNSYLKVVLDDQTLQRLHQKTLDIQEHWAQQQQLLPQSWPEGPGELPDPAGGSPDHPPPSASSATATKRPRRPLGIKPRTPKSLHMTLFFGGEVLCELPAQELESWHQAVTRRLQQFGFHLSSISAPSESDPDYQVLGDVQANQPTLDDMEFGLDLIQLRIFPPRRNNLIVAEFRASPAWNQLHDDLRALALHGQSAALSEVTTYSKGTWTPHITLANIVGGSQQEVKLLGDYLAAMSERRTGRDPTAHRVTVQGIAMGGPIPEQAPLDWNFRWTTSSP